jgi:multisubunit Na+/H+ antiporter MnhC subunit
VTILTTLLQRRLNMNYGRFVEQITSFNSTAVAWLGQYQELLLKNGYAQNDANAVTLYNVYGMAQKQAYVDAIDYAMMVTALGVLLALVLVMVMREGKSVEAKTDSLSITG